MRRRGGIGALDLDWKKNPIPRVLVYFSVGVVIIVFLFSVVSCVWIGEEEPTGDGIGYLEAKHHLLLSYCQDIVYYLLRKAKGLSVGGHPVLRSFVEIRLFLEKDNDGIYRPPKFMPASMDDEDKGRKQASRRYKALARMATENPYLKEIIDDAADRPEEWKETVGDESREFVKYMRQREKHEKQEEELFTRAPVTKRDKQMERQMRKQLHGLRGLTDGFDLGMNMLLDGDKEADGDSSKPHGKSGGQRKHLKSKKRKRH